MKLTVEQIENIKEKHPDFDFDKYLEWHNYIQEELCRPKTPNFMNQDWTVLFGRKVKSDG